MDKKNSIFQWALLGFFAFLALVGFLIFSTYKGGGNKSEEVNVGKVTIWGTMDKNIVESLIFNLQEGSSVYNDVNYVEKSKENYREEILEAMAANEAPDLILLSNEEIFANLNKIYKIPYSTMPQRDYLNSYADVFDSFLTKEGILGIPFSIDPLVMYYNRAIFRTTGIPLPPKYWSDFEKLANKINILDENKNIKRSAIAFGEASNIKNLKAILSTLLMQLNNDIVIYDYNNNFYTNDKVKKGEINSSQGIAYFTEFSNPISPIYSWNKSMPNSLDYFLSGRLGTYFGFASETPKIRFKNPNLDFDVAEIPGVEKMPSKAVFAKTWVLSIPKSQNVNRQGAFSVAYALSSAKSQKFLSEKLFLPPVRKDLLAQRPEESFMDIFYKEAIYARTFIDPDWKESNKIFKFMISSINGGRYGANSALTVALEELGLLLKK